jgi:hypothetical protein
MISPVQFRNDTYQADQRAFQDECVRSGAVLSPMAPKQTDLARPFVDRHQSKFRMPMPAIITMMTLKISITYVLRPTALLSSG